EAPGVGEVAFVATVEKTVAVKQAGERAGSVGSAGEAEKIDLIAFFVDLHEVAIGIQDVFFEAGAEGEAFDDGPLTIDPEAGAGIAHGADTGVIVGDLPGFVVEIETGVDLQDVGVRITELIAGAIAADDDVFAGGDGGGRDGVDGLVSHESSAGGSWYRQEEVSVRSFYRLLPQTTTHPPPNEQARREPHPAAIKLRRGWGTHIGGV